MCSFFALLGLQNQHMAPVAARTRLNIVLAMPHAFAASMHVDKLAFSVGRQKAAFFLIICAASEECNSIQHVEKVLNTKEIQC